MRGSSSALITIVYHFLLKGQPLKNENLHMQIVLKFAVHINYKLFFPTHTLLKQSRSHEFISVNARHLSTSIQGIIWSLSSDFLSITRREENARKTHGKAFEQLSAVVTFFGSINSGHGGLWSVSMALTSERSRDNLQPSASTQEEFEVSAL